MTREVVARSANFAQETYSRRVVRREALAEALKARGITHTERRLVEFIAKHCGTEARPLKTEEICDGADCHWNSLRTARPRAIEHGFILVENHRRPFVYALAEKWIV